MKKTIALVLIFLLPTVLLAQINRNRPIALKGITVIDVKNGAAKLDMTVIVAGNRITTVGKTGKIRIPKDAEVIDANGKFLIPGLWDMHAHTLTDNRYEWAFPLLIANGVTGVRDMGSNLAPENINEIRRNVADGKILAPRFGALTYRILDGAETQIYTAVAVTTPGEARQFVRDYKRLGSDFIKPYNLLSRETYLAMVDESGRQKIPLAGHVPFSMTAAEVSDLGQTTIEHNFGVLYSASRDEDEIFKELRAAPNRWARLEAKAAATFDEKKAALLFKRLAKNGTWVCPTIIVYRQTIHWDDEVFFTSDSRMKYVPQLVRERWHTQFEQGRANNREAENQKRWEMRSRIVSLEYHAGVRLIAGTDMGAFYVIPGFSMHDELQLMVEAGLSPLEALQTATINPAKFLGKENELGTIETGKLADLVLLDGNPLADIRNTTKIAAVIVNGGLLDKNKLAALLAEAETAANKK